jgi:hypothetical protein
MQTHITHYPINRRRFVTLLAQTLLVIRVRSLQLPLQAVSEQRDSSNNGYRQGGYGQGAYPARNDRNVYLPFISQKEK